MLLSAKITITALSCIVFFAAVGITFIDNQLLQRICIAGTWASFFVILAVAFVGIWSS